MGGIYYLTGFTIGNLYCFLRIDFLSICRSFSETGQIPGERIFIYVVEHHCQRKGAIFLLVYTSPSFFFFEDLNNLFEREGTSSGEREKQAPH